MNDERNSLYPELIRFRPRRADQRQPKGFCQKRLGLRTHRAHLPNIMVASGSARPKDSAPYVIPFVQDSVEPGAQVRTDGSAAYRSLKDLGYDHQRTVMLGSEVPAHVSMADVHRVAALVKGWILGTHRGSVQPEHLDAYLDEFDFRFNRRTSGSRGKLFDRLLQQAVVTAPVTYEDVVRKS